MLTELKAAKITRGAGKPGDIRLDVDRRDRLEFHGSMISSDGGFLLVHEMAEVLEAEDHFKATRLRAREA